MYQNNSLKVGNNEGSLMTGVKLPNLLGRGERLQVCCEWTSPQCLYQSKTFKQDTGAWFLDTDYTCTILQADYTYGTKKSSNFNLSLLKPLRGKLRSALTGNIYQVLFMLIARYITSCVWVRLFKLFSAVQCGTSIFWVQTIGPRPPSWLCFYFRTSCSAQSSGTFSYLSSPSMMMMP